MLLHMPIACLVFVRSEQHASDTFVTSCLSLSDVTHFALCITHRSLPRSLTFRHVTPSWARLVQTDTPYLINLNTTLSFTSASWVFRPKNLYASWRYIHATCPAHLVRLDLIIATFGRVQPMKILTIQFSVASIPSPHMNTPLSILRSNTNMYLLGQCETPSFTPIQYNRQNYNTLYN